MIIKLHYIVNDICVSLGGGGVNSKDFPPGH